MADVRTLFRQKFGPDWRWNAAISSLDLIDVLRTRRIKDDTLSRAIHFADIWRSHGLDEANRLEPLVAAANALDSDSAAVRQAKLLALGNCGVEHISYRLDLDVRVVQTWEDLRFAVRPAKDHLSWIVHRVISPETRHGDPRFARLMRLAALSGPDAAEILIDLDTSSSSSEVDWPFGEADRLLARRLKWELHFDTALDLIPTTAKEAKVFITAQDNLLHRRARLDLASRTLEERVREAARQHEIKSRQLEAKIARENRLAAEAAERTAARAARAEERAEKQRTIQLEDLLPTIPRLHRATDRTA